MTGNLVAKQNDKGRSTVFKRHKFYIEVNDLISLVTDQF